MICKMKKRGQPKYSGEEDGRGEQKDEETPEPNEPPNPSTTPPKATIPTPLGLRISVLRLGTHSGWHRPVLLCLPHSDHRNAALSSGSRSMLDTLNWVRLASVHSGYPREKLKQKENQILKRHNRVGVGV